MQSILFVFGRSAVAAGLLVVFLFSGRISLADNNGVALSPLMGWSSWSFIRNKPTASNIEAQALAMHNSLQAYGYQYVNVDDYWYLNPASTVDQYGRWTADPNKFPGGIAAVASYVHSLGLKFGIYLTAGIPVAAVNQNTPIQGTSYFAQSIANTSVYDANYNYGNCMYAINFSQPGAQAYVNSWANLLASWGVDYVKIDGVGVSTAADVQAWSQALKQTGRPILFDLSNSLAFSNRGAWSQYANSYRIDGDIEDYGGTTLTDWTNVNYRFDDVLGWNSVAAPGSWSNLDSLEIGNGNAEGLTVDERKSMMTLWSITAAPLSLGTDLTNFDSGDLSLLTNTKVLAVDQNGVAGAPLQQSGSQEIWRARQPDGSYAVAFFNRSTTSEAISANWSNLGFSGPADVYDLWAQTDLGSSAAGFSAALNTHSCQFLKVTPSALTTEYHIGSPLTSFSGGAHTSSSNVSPDGNIAQSIGNGAAVQFTHVLVSQTGTYNVTIGYCNGDTASRSGVITVNGSTSVPATFPVTGAWNAAGGLTVALSLAAGLNTIQIGNPSGWAPDILSLTVQNASPSGTQRFGIMNINSFDFLDVYGDSVSGGAGIVQYASNGKADQQWQIAFAQPGYFELVNGNSGFAIDDPGSSTSSGTQMIQWPIDGGSNQQWELLRNSSGYYNIVSRASAFLMDVSGASLTSGATVIQWPSNGGLNQQWALIPAP